MIITDIVRQGFFEGLEENTLCLKPTFLICLSSQCKLKWSITFNALPCQPSQFIVFIAQPVYLCNKHGLRVLSVPASPPDWGIEQ